MAEDAKVIEVVNEYAQRAQDAGLHVDVDEILAEMGIEVPAPEKTLTLTLTIPAAPEGQDTQSYVRNWLVRNQYSVADKLTITENDPDDPFAG